VLVLPGTVALITAELDVVVNGKETPLIRKLGLLDVHVYVPEPVLLPLTVNVVLEVLQGVAFPVIERTGAAGTAVTTIELE
jgi:hypothetical protein